MRWLVLIGAALLAAARWLAMSSPAHFITWLPEAWFRAEVVSLTRAALNVACSWLFLVVLPAAPIAALRLRTEEGWALGAGDRRIARLVPWLLVGGILFGGAAAAVSRELREHYPIYRAAAEGLPQLLLSEGLTLALILATELFYRGAPLFILERGFGRAAVYLLLPIYVLDHVGAPLGELVSSALGGALLGWLALRARSLWPGLAVHAGCAMAVDVVSVMLGRSGSLR